MSSDAVAAFLRSHRAASSDSVTWPGDLTLDVQTFLTADAPPRELVSSARAIVLREGPEVLVMTDQSPSTHILPGGRLEDGEEPVATVIREVAEESGWQVEPLEQIGVLRFRHLKPRADDWPHLYPVFFQTVYVACALELRPEMREVEGWEVEARFVRTADAANLALSAGERLLLAAALERIRAFGPTFRLNKGAP